MDYFMEQDNAIKHINNKVKEFNLKPLRCSHQAYEYAKSKDNDDFLYDFSYIWASLMQRGYDLKQQTFNDVADESLSLLDKYSQQASYKINIDRYFVVGCLNIILKFWADQQACKKLLKWFYHNYDMQKQT